jgi:hypothetical protein
MMQEPVMSTNELKKACGKTEPRYPSPGFFPALNGKKSSIAKDGGCTKNKTKKKRKPQDEEDDATRLKLGACMPYARDLLLQAGNPKAREKGAGDARKGETCLETSPSAPMGQP